MKFTRFPALLGLVLTVAVAHGAAATVRFAIVGDRTGSHVPGVYESIVAEVNALAPDYILTVGDHIEGYTEDVPTLESQWDEYDAIAKGFRDPLYVTPGNHDILNPTMEAEWRKRTGRDPDYTFERDGIHFVVLDTGRWESSEEWLAAEGHRAWLEADLAAHASAAMTIVVFHKPYWYDTLAEGKPDPLHDLFRKYGVDAVFNGHFHLYGTADYDGIRYTIVGSSGGAIDENEERGSFFGYLLCSVRDGNLDWGVLHKGAVRPAEATTVTDLKFFEHVDADYVKLEPVAVDERGESARVPTSVRIANGSTTTFRAGLQWDAGTNWSIDPASPSLEIAPGGAGNVTFRVARTGAFYPLPRLRFDYPYREGRTFRYETVLPALRIQRAGRAAIPPVVDGRIDDTMWQDAPTADAFCSPEGGVCVIEPTSFLFAYDDANLYLAARCSQAEMPALLVKATERDGSVSRDDCIGYFVSGDPEEKTFCQIYVSASGVVFDQKLTVTGPERYEGEGPKWNGDVRVAAGRGEDSWQVEAVVPFATLGFGTPKPGERWRINFRRKEISRGSSADWQYPIDYDPKRYGYLVFE